MSEQKMRPVRELKVVIDDGGHKTYKRIGNCWRRQFDDGSELVSVQLFYTDADVKDERYEMSVEGLLKLVKTARANDERPPFVNLEVPYSAKKESEGGSRSQQRRTREQSTISDADFIK